jgi:hypothetical protein
MNKKLSNTSSRINRAVRAESARRGISGAQLARILHRNVDFIYERFRLEKPFSTEDLDAIACALGISTLDIIKSANSENVDQRALELV